MSTNKWIPGVTKIYIKDPGICTTWSGQNWQADQAECERRGFRAVDPPVDAPAEKRELVAGWRRVPEGTCAMTGCKVPAPFKWVARHHEIPYCERHADEYGAFATPAPAKTCKPGCGELRVDGAIAQWGSGFKADTARWEDNPVMYCTKACRPAARAKSAEPKPAPMVSAAGRRCMFGSLGGPHCQREATKTDGSKGLWCDVHASAHDSPLAKPAPECKPRDSMDRGGGFCGDADDFDPDAHCGREEFKRRIERAKERLAKPAPAEKAKREWKAPREMVNGKLSPSWAATVFSETQHGQAATDARVHLLCNLLNERPPARVFPETRYNATITDAHGKLSRLVESGSRADARQDETRFEAGLRGVAK